jgi:hypothetical protein
MASSETIESCRNVAIERAHGLTTETFHQRYLSGCGHNHGRSEHRSACSTWSFAPFKSGYGSEGVVASIWLGDQYLKT